MHPKTLAASLALACALPWPAQAQAGPDDIRLLRQEIGALRANYEARLQALEQRLQAAETAAARPATATPAPATSPPVPAGAPAGANAFNPAVSLILSGLYARSTQDPARYAISGFPRAAAAEQGPGVRGFSLAESELGLAASIDPWWQGAAHIALHPDDTVSVEEAHVQTTGLGGGLTLKAGRFFSGIGYLNAQHAHTWDFVDSPLAYQALLGTQFGDDGVQLKWLAPTDLFLEFGAELGRGRGFPGGDNARNGAGSAALFAHAGGDLGSSHSWRAGVSVLDARASGQALELPVAGGDTVDAVFDGRTRVWVLDGVWKWAPEGNATRTSFKLQGELLRSTRRGTLASADAAPDTAGPLRTRASGWYVQGIYQFLPAWRVGLRTERLDPGPVRLGPQDEAAGRYRPRKHSLMLDFNASEFSRIRLQLARDRARLGAPDTQVFLQYQMSLGAHGAHAY